jgi:hypothetical protein
MVAFNTGQNLDSQTLSFEILFSKGKGRKKAVFSLYYNKVFK